jgi:hypothetical protein
MGRLGDAETWSGARTLLSAGWLNWWTCPSKLVERRRIGRSLALQSRGAASHGVATTRRPSELSDADDSSALPKGLLPPRRRQGLGQEGKPPRLPCLTTDRLSRAGRQGLMEWRRLVAPPSFWMPTTRRRSRRGRSRRIRVCKGEDGWMVGGRGGNVAWLSRAGGRGREGKPPRLPCLTADRLSRAGRQRLVEWRRLVALPSFRMPTTRRRSHQRGPLPPRSSRRVRGGKG